MKDKLPTISIDALIFLKFHRNNLDRGGTGEVILININDIRCISETRDKDKRGIEHKVTEIEGYSGDSWNVVETVEECIKTMKDAFEFK